MNIPLAIVIVCSIGASGVAQTKVPPQAKGGAGYFPPPGGSSALVVGGSNECAAASGADAISGPGTYSVTTVGATNGTPDAAGCVNTNIDVWFYWTSSVSGPVTIASCGGVTADSVITVWSDGSPAGSCPTTSIVCNDDSCGLQSSVTFVAVSGTSYFLQWGAFGAATTYSGTFTISTPPPPPVNDDCASPIKIGGPGSFPFDNSSATTGIEGQGEAACLFFGTTGITKDSWWTWTPTRGGTATFTTCGTTVPVGADTKVAIYDGAGCPVAAAIACNDDATAPTCAAGALNSTITWPTVCGQTYTIQLGQYPPNTGSFSGTFSITEVGASCGGFCFGDAAGWICPCSPVPVPHGTAGNGCPNSVNADGANLTTRGIASISADTLLLRASGMPNSSCLFFQGAAQVNGGLGLVQGDGLRCAGGAVIRLGTKLNANGASHYPDAGDLSVSLRGLVFVPGMRFYQAWYRNAAAFCTAATFNLTNGHAVTWVP